MITARANWARRCSSGRSVLRCSCPWLDSYELVRSHSSAARVARRRVRSLCLRATDSMAARFPRYLLGGRPGRQGSGAAAIEGDRVDGAMEPPSGDLVHAGLEQHDVAEVRAHCSSCHRDASAVSDYGHLQPSHCWSTELSPVPGSPQGALRVDPSMHTSAGCRP